MNTSNTIKTIVDQFRNNNTTTILSLILKIYPKQSKTTSSNHITTLIHSNQSDWMKSSGMPQYNTRNNNNNNYTNPKSYQYRSCKFKNRGNRSLMQSYREESKLKSRVHLLRGQSISSNCRWAKSSSITYPKIHPNPKHSNSAERKVSLITNYSNPGRRIKFITKAQPHQNSQTWDKTYSNRGNMLRQLKLQTNDRPRSWTHTTIRVNRGAEATQPTAKSKNISKNKNKISSTKKIGY